MNGESLLESCCRLAAFQEEQEQEQDGGEQEPRVGRAVAVAVEEEANHDDV